MISHKHKCIFVHIPKTGGMTIEYALGADLKKLHKRTIGEKHGTPRQWKYPKYWNEYFTFTGVRNPWDRLVSSYFYDLSMWRRGHRNRHRKLVKRFGKCRFRKYIIRHLNTRALHYRLQTDWFVDIPDYILRFENLQKDFNIVCDKIGIPQQQLPHKNKSKHKHYTEYYDDETRSIVAEKYAKDIEYFGYKFGE
jgi:chondroitin 4-sulfotransferase 11